MYACMYVCMCVCIVYLYCIFIDCKHSYKITRQYMKNMKLMLFFNMYVCMYVHVCMYICIYASNVWMDVRMYGFGISFFVTCVPYCGYFVTSQL